MPFEIRLETDCPKDWNSNLLKSPMGNIFNTFEYSEYAKKRLNWIPKFASILESNGELMGQVVLFEFVSKKFGRKIPKIFSKFTPKSSKKIRWTYGPIIFSNDNEQAVNLFLEFVKKMGNRIEGSLHPFFNGKLSTKGIKEEKWSTFLIDLKQSKEIILKNTDKKSVQKNIERAKNRDVMIYEINDETIKEYHELLNEYRLESGNPQYDFEDTFDLWNLLKPLGFKGYLAKKDESNVGGITFSFFNGYINEWGIARTKKDTLEKLYSQDLLKWKIIEWGTLNNQKFYDLSGFNPNPLTKKEEGILQYKKKWGGIQNDFWKLRK